MRQEATRVGLADLVDLELALLELDRHRLAAEETGRALLAETGESPAQALPRAEAEPGWRRVLAMRWLERLRHSGAPLPGQRLAAALRLAARLLQFLGLLLGAGAASAVLAYDGSAPVNLWNFLGVFVLLQILLLLVSLLLLGLGAARGRALPGPLQRGLAAFAHSRLSRRLLGISPEAWQQDAAALRRHAEELHTRRSLHRATERWFIFRSVQAAGVSFHLAAAAVFLWLVLFSDLAFAWSTTPAGVDASWLHGLVDGLAAPWSWLAPDTVPSLDQVQATQWNRLERRFASAEPATGAAAAAAWWSFLLLAQLGWGLAPRLLAWLLAGWRLRTARAAVDFDHAGFHTLFDAMLGQEAARDWQAPAPEEVRAPWLTAAAAAPTPPAEPLPPARQAQAVLWGGFPLPDRAALAARIDQRFGWTLQNWAEAGGADADADQAAWQAVRNAAARQGSAAVAVLAEGAESPDKALLRRLSALREDLGPPAALLVVLIDAPTPAQLALWRRYLARLGDPHLRVEALG